MLSSPRIPNPLWSSISLDRSLVSSGGQDAFLFEAFQGVAALPGNEELSLSHSDPPAIGKGVSVEEERATVQPGTSQIHDNASLSTTLSRPSSTFQRWKRRLVTREDSKHLHKITGALFLLSSWGLSGYAIRDLLSHGWTQPVTSHGKPFLGLLLVLLASSVVQSFSSVCMACRYRRNQPAVRNTFLCNAAVAILGSVSALWSSAWYPTALNGAPGMAFYLVMDAIGLIGMGDNLVRLRALIAEIGRAHV